MLGHGGAKGALRILELCSVMAEQTILLLMLMLYVIPPERIYDPFFFFLLTELCA